MSRWTRTLGLVGLVAFLLPVPGAHAGTNAVVVEGSGSIVPGLPCASTCTIWIDFTIVRDGADGEAITDCHFEGITGDSDTILAGSARGSISCSDGSSGSATFTRTATLMTMAADLQVGGSPAVLSLVLAFVPQNINPTIDFVVSGGGYQTGGGSQLPSCNTVNAAGVCVHVVPGSLVQRVGVAEPGSSGSGHVVGSIDIYSIPLPTGGAVTFPCVVLTIDGTGNSGCTVGGATKVSTLRDLVDTYAVGSSPIVSVGVCAAQLTATVAGFGVQNVPAYTIC